MSPQSPTQTDTNAQETVIKVENTSQLEAYGIIKPPPTQNCQGSNYNSGGHTNYVGGSRVALGSLGSMSGSLNSQPEFYIKQPYVHTPIQSCHSQSSNNFFVVIFRKF